MPTALDRRTTIVSRARERWPELSERGEWLEPESDDDAGMPIDRAAERYLTRACAAGDRLAIQAFEREFFVELRAWHSQARSHGLGVDELEQQLRDKLFVRKAITRFSGKGELRRWLRVLTTRLLVDHMRSLHPEVALEDELVPHLLDAAADATLAKAELRAAFRCALREAFAALSDRQKLLLRSEIRGTSLSAIATTYCVHPRSIQRWLRDAHEAFAAAFRRALVDRLRIPAGEVSSVLRFARSQLGSGLGELFQATSSSRLA